MQDIWAHTFDETYHLHHVHDKYGSHHLEKEIANTSSESDHNKSRGSSKIEDQVAFHLLPSANQNDFNLSKSGRHYLLLAAGKLTSIIISLQGPPPKFL